MGSVEFTHFALIRDTLKLPSSPPVSQQLYNSHIRLLITVKIFRS